MSSRETFLIRFSGEVCTKARKTRHRFTRQIASAVEDALLSTGVSFSIEREWSRLFVRTDDSESGKVLSRIFGVQSVSRVKDRKWTTLDDIVRAGRELFADSVTGKKFAVRARRTGGNHRFPFSSPDIERALGAELLPFSSGVDLDAPEVTASVEAHSGRAYFFKDSIPGPGGMPVSVDGRALSLISGGFDSAVASWLMLKRGVGLDYLFFNLGGQVHLDGTLSVLEPLAKDWSYGDWPRLFVVDLRPLVPMIEQAAHPRYWQLLLKFVMYRVGEALAREIGLSSLVTGEAVGQVSSQTLPNLEALTRTVEIPLMRPVLAYNKDEIVARAREIRTYEPSAKVEEYCSLQARHSETHVALEELVDVARGIDLAMLQEVLATRHVVELRARAPGAGESLTLEPGEISPTATLVDLRTAAEFQQWHPPGALNLEFSQALKAYTSFDRDRSYVLYCEIGFKSAHLAEAMREEGFEAFNVAGGSKGLRRAYGQARKSVGLVS